MNDFRQKLLSAGLGVVMLLGACAPLTAMAAQTNASQAQPPAASAPAKTDTGSAGQAVSIPQPPNSSGQDSAAASAGQGQTQAQLAAQAKVSETEAVAAAQAAYPGSTVTVEELDGENGSVLYELKVQPADGGKAFETAVDAVTGELLAAESED